MIGEGDWTLFDGIKVKNYWESKGTRKVMSFW